MTETLARPVTESPTTRQCVCGGWTRFSVCQYCGTPDPNVAAAMEPPAEPVDALEAQTIADHEDSHEYEADPIESPATYGDLDAAGTQTEPFPDTEGFAGTEEFADTGAFAEPAAFTPEHADPGLFTPEFAEPSFAAFPSYDASHDEAAPAYETAASFDLTPAAADVDTPPSFETPVFETAEHQSLDDDVSGYDASAFELPSYDASAFELPSYDSPAFDDPDVELPGQELPAFELGTVDDQPAAAIAPATDAVVESLGYDVPGHDVPGYDSPVFAAPAVETLVESTGYDAPVYEAPGFEAPVFEAPPFEAPTFEAPTFDLPAVEQPVAESWFEEPAVDTSAADADFPPVGLGFAPLPDGLEDTQIWEPDWTVELEDSSAATRTAPEASVPMVTEASAGIADDGTDMTVPAWDWAWQADERPATEVVAAQAADAAGDTYAGPEATPVEATPFEATPVDTESADTHHAESDLPLYGADFDLPAEAHWSPAEHLPLTAPDLLAGANMLADLLPADLLDDSRAPEGVVGQLDFATSAEAAVHDEPVTTSEPEFVWPAGESFSLPAADADPATDEATTWQFALPADEDTGPFAVEITAGIDMAPSGIETAAVAEVAPSVEIGPDGAWTATATAGITHDVDDIVRLEAAPADTTWDTDLSAAANTPEPDAEWGSLPTDASGTWGVTPWNDAAWTESSADEAAWSPLEVGPVGVQAWPASVDVGAEPDAVVAEEPRFDEEAPAAPTAPVEDEPAPAAPRSRRSRTLVLALALAGTAGAGAYVLLAGTSSSGSSATPAIGPVAPVVHQAVAPVINLSNTPVWLILAGTLQNQPVSSVPAIEVADRAETGALSSQWVAATNKAGTHLRATTLLFPTAAAARAFAASAPPAPWHLSTTGPNQWTAVSTVGAVVTTVKGSQAIAVGADNPAAAVQAQVWAAALAS